jgi:hypothetical protein
MAAALEYAGTTTSSGWAPGHNNPPAPRPCRTRCGGCGATIRPIAKPQPADGRNITRFADPRLNWESLAPGTSSPKVGAVDRQGNVFTDITSNRIHRTVSMARSQSSKRTPGRQRTHVRPRRRLYACQNVSAGSWLCPDGTGVRSPRMSTPTTWPLRRRAKSTSATRLAKDGSSTLRE